MIDLSNLKIDVPNRLEFPLKQVEGADIKAQGTITVTITIKKNVDIITVDRKNSKKKTQEKSERPVYHKDIAQLIKTQLDSTKGSVVNFPVSFYFSKY